MYLNCSFVKLPISTPKALSFKNHTSSSISVGTSTILSFNVVLIVLKWKKKKISTPQIKG